MKTSAYLSVFDDFELLGPAMASIAPRVDEIVVVDGAYRWMAPLFTAMGRDPTRSDDRVRDAMAPYAQKTRWINALWEGEPAKRVAGFAACTHRYVWRVDADEIHFIRDDALDRFFASGHAIGEMEIPLYVAPGLIRGRTGGPIERTSLLYDSAKIDAGNHLAYLWLEISAGERARLDPVRSDAVAPEAIAFTAHLTEWRPPATSVARARFYVLRYTRTHGPEHPQSWLRFDPARGLAPMLEEAPPGTLEEVLMGHPIVTGPPDLKGMDLLPSPLSPAQEAGFTPLYDAYLDALAQANATMARRGRHLRSGIAYGIDLSTPQAAAPFLQDGVVHLRFSAPLAAVTARLEHLQATPPYAMASPLPATATDRIVRIPLPRDPGDALRRVLRVAVWPEDGRQLLKVDRGL